MTAHTLLAQTLAGAVYFAGFVVLAIAGIPLQDRKLRKRWKNTYAEFENSTSIVPFTPSQQSMSSDKIEWNFRRNASNLDDCKWRNICGLYTYVWISRGLMVQNQL